MSRRMSSASLAKHNKEDEFLRRKRFHSKMSWPGKPLKDVGAASASAMGTSASGGVGATGSSSSGQGPRTLTLPPGLNPTYRYSRITPRLSVKPPRPPTKPPESDPEWEDVYEDDFEEKATTVKVIRRAPPIPEVRVPPPSPPPSPLPALLTAEVQTHDLGYEKERKEQAKHRRHIRELLRTVQPLSTNVQTQIEMLEETRKSLKRLANAHEEFVQRVDAGELGSGAHASAAAAVTQQQAEQHEHLMESLREIREMRDRVEEQTAGLSARSTDGIVALTDSVQDVMDAIETRMVPMDSFVSFSGELRQEMAELNDKLDSLKRRHDHLVTAMERSNTTQEKLLQQEESLKHVASLLEDIHGYTMEKKAEDVDQKKRRKVKPNKSRGELFLHSNNLPLEPPAVVELVAEMLAYIEYDDEKELEKTLEEFRMQAPKIWGSLELVKKAVHGLFKTALFMKSNKSSLLLAGTLTSATPKNQNENAGEEASKKNMAEFIRGAINFENRDMGRQLLDRMDNQWRKQVVNTAVKGKYGAEGSYLLFVTIRSGDLEMFKVLVQCGADLRMREGPKENSILHMMCKLSMDPTKEENILAMLDVLYKEAGVWYDQKDSDAANDPDTLASESSRIAGLRELFNMKDANGLKPLQVAARNASPKMIAKFVQNPPYHTLTDPVTFDCDAKRNVYFMDDIDVRFSNNMPSVLEMIVDRDKDGLEIVKMEPFRQVLSDKWDRYRVFYWIWFVLYLLYMFTYSACAVGRHLNTKTIMESYSTSGDMVRGIAEMFCVLTLPLFFYGAWCDSRRGRFDKYKFFTDTVRLGNVFFVVLVLITLICRIFHTDIEDIFLCLSLLTGWLLTTRFLLATPSMGVFPSVIFKVVKEDILKRFIFIFLILLLGNAVAMYCAYQRDNVEELPSDSFWTSLLSVMKLTFGMLETGYVTQGHYPIIGVILFVIYVWLGNILLVNMLIAMVNDTYANAKLESQETWVHTKAWYALLMERRLPLSVWIPYDNQRHDQAKPNKQWKLMDKWKFYSQTRLRYGHRIRPRRSHQEEQVIEYFVITK